MLFFDDECGLGNIFVRQVIRRDTARVFRFAPIQGQTGQALLPPLPRTPEDWMMVLWDGGTVYVGSDAVLRALGRLNGWRTPTRLLLLIPRGARERVYRYIARRRLNWFGKADVCERLSRTDAQQLLLP